MNGVDQAPGTTDRRVATTDRRVFLAGLDPIGLVDILDDAHPDYLERAGMKTVKLAELVAIDAIGVAGFDLNFYRQLVRDTSDAPEKLEPLRRWTCNPHVFLQTTALVDARTLDMVERTIRDAVARDGRPDDSAWRPSNATT